VCVCVGFFSRVSFFFFWLVLPWPSWRVDLVPKAGTAAPEAAAVIMRVLDNQHACFIVSSSSRQRPSLLFHLALTVSLSPSLAPSPSRARPRELRPLGKRSDASPDEGPGFVILANPGNVGTKRKTNANSTKSFFGK
jgi:hypothetical protein